MGFEMSNPQTCIGKFTNHLVPMSGRLMEACAIPIGWQGAPYTSEGLPALKVSLSGQEVSVSGGEAGGTLTFVVMAQTLDALSPTEVITVQWGSSELTVDKPDLVVSESCTLMWLADQSAMPDEKPFNIVSVLGFPPIEFGSPTSFKPEEGQSLSWRVRDYARQSGVFHYSLLAQKGEEVRYLDPKITNKPSFPDQTPTGVG